MRIVQLRNAEQRRVALVREPHLELLSGFCSVFELANASILEGRTLSSLIHGSLSGETLLYDSVYTGASPWKLLPPVDHPMEAARCVLSGTGLTHLGSAKDRSAMHSFHEQEITDSIRMFQWGVSSGKPEPGTIGVAPEWFYKGNGSNLLAHGEELMIPSYAEDGGEEAEVAACYIVGPNGEPYRLGLAAGNEFSDHVFEKMNYLNLAGSKLRTCSLGPELAVNPPFDSVPGRVSLKRDGNTFWSKDIRTGETEMCHSLRNIEHHHFKFEIHRQPGDVHVHYLGASLLSFGEDIRLHHGDLMEVSFEGLGRPLWNSVRRISSAEYRPVHVHPFV